MNVSLKKALLFLVLALIGTGAYSHEMRSVLLTVTEHTPVENDQSISAVVTVNLKSSLDVQGRPASVTVKFEPACLPQGSSLAERTDDAVLRTFAVSCDKGLNGRKLLLEGLNPTTPDAFVQVHFANGSISQTGLSRANASLSLNDSLATESQIRPLALLSYFYVGIEHILLGIDHLLFVLGLLLLLRQTGAGWQTLVTTITAFTLAHSITLGMSVLAGVSLPSTPVEIVIALSILLLAYEICRQPRNSRTGLTSSLTARKPWLAAFGFGLLHGFGFAGALGEIGLPAETAGWALLLFNLGVESGQLIFVGVAVLVLKLITKLPRSMFVLRATEGLLVYSIGGLAMFWILDRSAPLLGF